LRQIEIDAGRIEAIFPVPLSVDIAPLLEEAPVIDIAQ
jgi:hypothetical protein